MTASVVPPITSAGPTNVADYLLRSAARNPGKAAVVDGARTWTYQQLLEQSQRAATALISRGLRRRAVMLVMEKSADMLATMMGTLMAGACYVPVDPHLPAERVAHIANQLANPLVVSCDDTPAAALSQLGDHELATLAELLDTPADAQLIAAAREDQLETDPAYVLFTSGSTGAPKGVAISHRAIVSFIESFTRLMELREDDRFANQAPFDFDVSTKDIYSTLSLGATLVLVDRRLFMEPAALVSLLDRERVTVLTWAVAALCIVSGYHALDEADLSTVRKVLFSGEVMPYRHLRQWRAKCPQATFVNLYGPTEITCNCLYHVLDPERSYKEGIPLGRPFPHCDVRLLAQSEGASTQPQAEHEGELETSASNAADTQVSSLQNLQVTQPGQRGQLVVSGPSLALGYVGAPEQTSRVFVQSPFQTTFPERCYLTGDVAEISPAGEWLFAGRTDNQIKYQGHRIELEEIDTVFEALPGVTRCRCAFDARAKRICAFYEGTIDRDELVGLARERLASHMRPSTVERVETMPLTSHGKVDRAALLASWKASLRAAAHPTHKE
jgi:non-ribosomal peptide synthetase component F